MKNMIMLSITLSIFVNFSFLQPKLIIEEKFTQLACKCIFAQELFNISLQKSFDILGGGNSRMKLSHDFQILNLEIKLIFS